MGVINHDALLITTGQDPAEWSEFKNWLAKQDIIYMVQQKKSINGYWTICIPPDGSKEGWENSDQGDLNREKVIDRINKTNRLYCEFVEISYGEYGTSIKVSNCEDRY